MKAQAINFFGASMMQMVSTQTWERLTLYKPYWCQQTSLNSKSS